MSTRLHIVVSEELLARIDGALGPGQPRADFIRRAVEQALDGQRRRGDAREAESPPAPAERPGHAHPDEWDANSGAMAEQPQMPTEADREMFRRPVRDMLPRASSQAKRDVAPVPKRGEKK